MTIYRTAGDRPRIDREEQLLCETPRIRVGVFEARIEDPHFRESGAPGEYLLVFPLTSVRLELESMRPFVADRNVVTFYNPDQVYRRSVASRHGDRAHWFGLEPEAVEQILGASGSRPPAAAGRLFPFAVGPCDTRSYELQLGLIKDLASPTPPAASEVEERVLEICRRVARWACGAGGRHSASPRLGRCDWVEAAREYLAVHYAESSSVHDVAGAVGCSPYHLCRRFRRETGLTMHAYRECLRLRRALIELDDRRGDLTGLALELGYSSHSHFTVAFRRMFGLTPSRYSSARWSPRQISG